MSLAKILNKKSPQKKSQETFVFGGRYDAIRKAMANPSSKVYQVFPKRIDLLPLYIVAPSKDVALDRYLAALYSDVKNASDRIAISDKIEVMFQIAFN